VVRTNVAASPSKNGVLKAMTTCAKLIYASTNAGKLTEAKSILGRFGLEILDLRTAADNIGLSRIPTIAEPDSTYQGNAERKAAEYSKLLRAPCISDDTGLEIEELGWLPGVYTAHFGFERVRNALIADRPYSARFVCCVSYAEPEGRLVSVTERLSGVILFQRAAMTPYSSVPYSHFFIPDDASESLHVLTARGGEFLSHRGRALAMLCRCLDLSDLAAGRE
jgi:XTP/dITP diphosphohydrolase